jgi:hypothetical protein
MQRSDAQARLDEVQRIMERTTLNTVLPGWPAIIAGCLALGGCVASYFLLGGSLDFRRLVVIDHAVAWGFCILWAVIGVVAIGQEVLLSRWAAKRHGLSARTRPGQLAALSLTPSVAVAAILTAKLLADEGAADLGGAHVRLIVPIWMMCYGTGVYAAGLFSVRLPRLLGVAFIVLGAAGLLWFSRYAVLLTAVSFGLLHVVFGVLVLARASRSEADERTDPAGQD